MVQVADQQCRFVYADTFSNWADNYRLVYRTDWLSGVNQGTHCGIVFTCGLDSSRQWHGPLWSNFQYPDFNCFDVSRYPDVQHLTCPRGGSHEQRCDLPLPDWHWSESEFRAHEVTFGRVFLQHWHWGVDHLRPTGEPGFSVELLNIDRFTLVEKQLLASAAGVISGNLDLLQWAMCLVYGDEHSGCLLRHFRGRKPTRTHFRKWFTPLESMDDPDETFFFSPPLGGITVNNGALAYWAEAWRKAGGAWSNGLETDSDTARRASITIFLAGILAHEMAHQCFRTLNDPWVNDEEDCAATYLLESTMTWALLQRYPWANQEDSRWDSDDTGPCVESREGLAALFYSPLGNTHRDEHSACFG